MKCFTRKVYALNDTINIEWSALKIGVSSIKIISEQFTKKSSRSFVHIYSRKACMLPFIQRAPTTNMPLFETYLFPKLVEYIFQWCIQLLSGFNENYLSLRRNGLSPSCFHLLYSTHSQVNNAPTIFPPFFIELLRLCRIETSPSFKRLQ